MNKETGVELPPRMKPAKIGSRWLSVIPIAQAAVIRDVLVQLASIERHDDGAILNARISRLEEMILTEPRNAIPWPTLDLTARDDTGIVHRVDGGYGNGSQSDWQVEYGISGGVPKAAKRLDIIVTELRWDDLQTDTVLDRITGEVRFTVDLTRELATRWV